MANPISQAAVSARTVPVPGGARIFQFVRFLPGDGVSVARSRFEPRGVPGRRDRKVMMETYGTLDAFLETLIAMGGTGGSAR